MPPEQLNELDIHAWSAALQVAASSTTEVSAEDLLRSITNLEELDHLPQPNVVTYTTAINGLVARQDYELALRLFESSVLPRIMSEDRSSGLDMDAQLLQAIFNAWVGYDGGSLRHAMEVVGFFASSRSFRAEAGAKPLPSYDGRQDISQYYQNAANNIWHVDLDVIFINNLLTTLAKSGHLHLVWKLWSNMERYYQVAPDDFTLAILCKAAISVSKHLDHSRAIPDFAEDVFDMRGPPASDPDRHPDAPSEDLRLHPVETLAQPSEDDAKLERDLRKGLWNGMRPHLAVREVYLSMLEDNYPAIASKVNQTRPSMARSLFGITNRLPMQRSSNSSQSDSQRNERKVAHLQWTRALQSSSALTDPAKNPKFPQIHPTSANMHIFIALLGYFNISAEIPYVLQYMRHLGIYVPRKTLCLALLAREESGAYVGQLKEERRWLVDWLGEHGVPTDDELSAYRRRQWSRSR